MQDQAPDPIITAGSYPAEANRLTNLLYEPGIPPEHVAEACFAWGSGYPAPPPHRKPWSRGRLRVGYLSGNFRANPEVFFTLPLLRHHDREAFDIYCYSNAPEPDAFTRRFRRLPVRWRDISRVTDAAAASLIESDGIDVLVDLGGHWANGRVPLFALRPAPVQISLATYPCTTGLAAMDFRITDAHADPPGATEHLHSEQLVRLDRCYCCYQLPRPLPKPGPLPALRNGFVTFGCFHRPQKLSAELLRLWSAILMRVPRSRILFHHAFDAACRGPILVALERQGVPARRILFAGYRPFTRHLAVIARADIALDSFPYHGMTLTCESLAMGVPVVTLAGRSHVSRAGVSILNSVGLGDWIASDGEAYIETASARARGLDGLSRLRAALPRRVRESPLTDARGYAHALEEVYRACCGRAGKR